MTPGVYQPRPIRLQAERGASRLLTPALTILALGLAALSLATGPADLATLPASLARAILVEIRLPRALLALAIGGSLALAGAALQGLLRNPLASPDMLGGSAGAGLGAVAATYWAAASGTLGLAAGAIAGAAAALALLLALAGRGARTTTLILAGVAISSLAGAATSLALSLAPSPFALYDALFWLMGSLADRGLPHVAIALPPIALGSALLLRTRRHLDRLALGEEVAATLGTDVAALRLRIVVGTALVVGGGVAVAGAIGFVGLAVPHLVRPLAGQRPGAALVPAFAGGAALLVAADLAVRLTPGPELHLGVLTALIGAPFFLWLVVNHRRAGA